jgi:hypothetical protein
VQFGVNIGVGDGLVPHDDPEEIELGSEFGFIPATIWGSYRLFF